VRIELLTRAAQRSTPGSAIPGSLRDARAALDETLAGSGLEDFALSAAARVGRRADDPLSEQPAIVEPPDSLPIPRFGRPLAYRVLSDRDETESAAAGGIRSAAGAGLSDRWRGAASAFPALVAAAAMVGRRRDGFILTAFAIAALASAAWLGTLPPAVIAAVAGLVLGRILRWGSVDLA
jgi:hypothetical protein